MSLTVHVCSRKAVFRSRQAAESLIARWRAEATLRYPVYAYACPFDPAYWHIGRAKRARRRSS